MRDPQKAVRGWTTAMGISLMMWSIIVWLAIKINNSPLPVWLGWR